MAEITAQEIAETGSAVSFTQVAATCTLVNNGKAYYHVKNVTAATCTISVAATRECDHGFEHDMSMTVPATTGDKVLGPFPTRRFGTVPVVTISATTLTGVTAALVTYP
jgi:hypothetical protein